MRRAFAVTVALGSLALGACGSTDPGVVAITTPATSTTTSTTEIAPVDSTTVASPSVATTAPPTPASSAPPAPATPAGGTQAPNPASTVVPPAGGAPTTVATDDPLAKLLPTNLPADFVVQPDSVGDTGPSDLDKAVRDDGSADARDVLTKAGFVHGYQRLWSNDTTSQDVVIFLYQFKTAPGAASFETRSVALVKNDTTPTDPFTVTGIAGATGVSVSDPDGGAAVVLYAKGPDTVQVVATGPAGDKASLAELQTLAVSVATAQSARL